jgi:hypothetical protein
MGVGKQKVCGRVDALDARVETGGGLGNRSMHARQVGGAQREESRKPQLLPPRTSVAAGPAPHLQDERAYGDLSLLRVRRARLAQHLDHDGGAAHRHDGPHKAALQAHRARGVRLRQNG